MAEGLGHCEQSADIAERAGGWGLRRPPGDCPARIPANQISVYHALIRPAQIRASSENRLGFTDDSTDRSANERDRQGGGLDAEVHQATEDRVALASDVHPTVQPLRRSPAPETLRLYAGDWAAFVACCRLAGAVPLPAVPATVADYLTTLGERLSAGALARRAAAIAAQHRSYGLISPASDPAVTTLLRQARRTATRRRAPPPAAARLIRVATACPGDLAGMRDRTLLLLPAACPGDLAGMRDRNSAAAAGRRLPRRPRRHARSDSAVAAGRRRSRP